MSLVRILSKLRRAGVLGFAVVLLAAPVATNAAVFVSVNFAPPPIPVYVQPVAPAPDFIWIPGYWAYGPYGYYWVPGTWVLAPYVGALWTPGYWGWGGAAYIWHAGYWGPRVGYYGGINYGFGYFGVGYYGGYWNAGHFFYNTSVTHVDVTRVHNTYNRTVVQNDVRVSYNGGAGGVRHSATDEERLAERDTHRAALPMQVQHERFASTQRDQRAAINNGAPALASTQRVQTYNRSMQTDARPGRGGPQPAHVDTFHADRGNAPTGHGQARAYDAPHAGGPPQQVAGPQGAPGGGGQHGHQGSQGGGKHHEGEQREGHPGR
jgi:YXWGXW repeat-containing protein